MNENPRPQRPRAVPISADELARIAEYLAIVDEFLRSETIPEQFAEHLRATGLHDPSNPYRYDAAYLIDQISFTAHALHGHRP